MRLLKFCLLNVTKKPLAFIKHYLLILNFEKMKKLFGIIAIVLLFSFAGTQEVYAGDWDIVVTWSDDCGECTGIGSYEYYVCLKITNTCTETVVYGMNCVTLSSSYEEWTFNVGEICIPDSYQCFEVSARVIKRCVVSKDIICQNTETDTYSCDEIKTGFPFDCSIQ